MQRLIYFLYRSQVVVLFVVLQSLNVWLIIRYNQRYNASFFNSSNVVAGQVFYYYQNILDYFKLKKVNQQLIIENQLLQSRLNEIYIQDHTSDTLRHYTVIGAKVINNSFRRSQNFLTIDVGFSEGVVPGMGVISPLGVVGQVRSVTSNFASIYSVLHPNVMVSSLVKRTNTNGTVQWDQKAYDKASLKFIPRHIDMKVGDSVVTSGYNSVFPEGILVGIVDDFTLEDHMTFYEATIKLSTDFTSLPNVFVIRSELKSELDSIAVL